MARYAGKIGYAEQKETAPGVWRPVITERSYRGDITRVSHRWTKGEQLNDDIDIQNEISIVADPYAYLNLGLMRYVTWMGTKWRIKSIEVQRPRIILSIGGVWNGSTPGTK